MLAIAAGLLLGVVSRIEETTDNFDVGISENATWLAAALLAGLVAPPSPARGALAGAGLLTAANAGYYAYILATQPGVPLASVAGPPERWFVLGIVSGAALGVAGVLVRAATGPIRVLAALLLPVVVLGDVLGLFATLLP